MRQFSIGSIFAFGLAVMLQGSAWAGALQVPGTQVRYGDTLNQSIGKTKVGLKLTGAGTRTKFFVKVYTIGSYVDPSAKVQSASELAHSDIAKSLEMVLLRDVDGRTIASSFETMIKANHHPSKFPASMRQMSDFFKANPVRRGQHVSLIHVPKEGLHVKMDNGKSVMIRDVEFSKAVWDIYLGPKNVGETVKTGLTSRL